jgi:phosphoribosylamine--glycine ligase
MKVLIIGSGAREHALAWKIAQSPLVGELYVAPGNAGTASIARNIPVEANNIDSLITAARTLKIDLAVVGPEAPLAIGIVDEFIKYGIPIFGPTKEAARIETSKVFAKHLMQKYSIPCARGVTFSDYAEAMKYIVDHPLPVVVKADGLAAGKGVTVAFSKDEAIMALSNIMEKKIFGAAGNSVVIEEYLAGREVSLLAFSDGETVVPMVPACDYKRAFDNDEGPNTGGMGSYSPPSFFDSTLVNQATKTILSPAIEAMSKEGSPYKGVLYAGLMLTAEGPKVLEFNARFGDPETQVILPRLKTDLLEIFLAVLDARLNKTRIEWSPNACVGVVMASHGYPGSYKTGFPISGLNHVDNDVLVFHAGTRLGEDAKVYTAGGRVLTVTATGTTIADARNKVYDNLPRITFEGCYYRKDIALREVSQCPK